MRSREDSEEISLKHSGYAYVYTREGSLVAGGKWVRVAADLENLTLRLDNTHMTETNRDKYCKEMTITAGTTVLRAPQPGRPHCLALSDFNAASGKRRVLDCLTQEGVTAWFDLLTRVATTDLDTLLEPLRESREKRRDGGDLEDALRSAPAKVEVALLALRRGRLPADYVARDAAGRGVTALLAAARSGRADVIGALVGLGAAANGPELGDSEKAFETPLLGAVRADALDAARALLASGADPTLADGFGARETPLLCCARRGSAEIARALLRSLAKLAAGEADGDARSALLAHPDRRFGLHPETALEAAAVAGHGAVVMALAGGAFAKAEDGTRCTCRATATASDPLTKKTPLHLAAERGRAAVVAPLAAAGAVVDVADGDGVPPLVYAVRAGHVACVAALLQRDAVADVGAAAAGEADASARARQLVAATRDLRASLGSAAFDASSAADVARSVRSVIRDGELPRNAGTALANFPADVCAAAPDDRFTALLRCCANGDGQGAELWLTLGADANHADHGPEKRTPLMACAARGDTHLAKMLLATGRCAVDARDALGCSALCRAAEAAARSRAVPVTAASARDVCALLLAHGADPLAMDAKGRSPLSVAAADARDARLVSALLAAPKAGGAPDGGRKRPDVDAPHGPRLATALMLAAALPEASSVLRTLLGAPELAADAGLKRAGLKRRSGSRASLQKRDARGRTALFYAAEADRPENVELLLGLGRRSSAGSDAGAGGESLAEMLDVDATDDSGHTALRVATAAHAKGAVGALLRFGASASRPRDGPLATTPSGAERPKRPLSIALEAGDAQIAHTLGRFRASVLCGDEPATLRYVDRGNYVVDEPAGLRDGAVTALLVACRLGHGPAAKRLLDAGADPNRADAAGETPLLAAARSGALLDGCPRPPGSPRAAGDESGDDPGERCLARALLDAGADARAADDARAETPLHVVCGGGGAAGAAKFVGGGRTRGEAAALLLAHGADPERPDCGGRTPLLLAAGAWPPADAADYVDELRSDGELDVVDDVPAARPGGRCDAAEVLKAILLHHGRSPVDLNRRCRVAANLRSGAAAHELTALGAAAAAGRRDAVLALLRVGADPDVAGDGRGRAPLAIAAARGAASVVAALARAPCAVDRVSPEDGGATALHEAARAARVAAVAALLRCGAVAAAPDAAGRAPVDVCGEGAGGDGDDGDARPPGERRRAVEVRLRAMRAAVDGGDYARVAELAARGNFRLDAGDGAAALEAAARDGDSAGVDLVVDEAARNGSRVLGPIGSAALLRRGCVPSPDGAGAAALLALAVDVGDDDLLALALARGGDAAKPSSGLLDAAERPKGLAPGDARDHYGAALWAATGGDRRGRGGGHLEAPPLLSALARAAAAAAPRGARALRVLLDGPEGDDGAAADAVRRAVHAPAPAGGAPAPLASPLHAAAAADRVEALALLLRFAQGDQSLGALARDPHHRTPLHVAASHRAYDAAAVLVALHAGDDGARGRLLAAADAAGAAPLHRAARADDGAVASLLLGAGADSGARDLGARTPRAAARGRGRAARRLDAMRAAIGDGDFDRALRLVARGCFAIDAAGPGGETVLARAAAAGRDDVLEAALALAATSPAAGPAPAHLHGALAAAAARCQPRAAEVVLRSDATARPRPEDSGPLLRVAVARRRHALAELLLLRGVEPLGPCDGALFDGADVLPRGDAAPVAPAADAPPPPPPQRATTPFFVAVETGDLDAVRIFLDQRVAVFDVDAPRPDGSTALMAALARGHVAVAHALLAAGADATACDSLGRSALERACFDHASAKAELRTVAVALDAAKALAAGGGGAAPARRTNAALLDRALALAVAQRDAGAVAALLDAGADALAPIDGGPATPLLRACGAPDLATLAALVDGRELDVDARHGANGTTCLQVLAASGDADACRCLLGAGADPARADAAGRGPLWHAAHRGHGNACHALAALAPRDRAARAAVLDAPDRDGLTPLHAAARVGARAAVAALLAAGADATARDRRGLTPRQLALVHGHAAAATQLAAMSHAVMDGDFAECIRLHRNGNWPLDWTVGNDDLDDGGGLASSTRTEVIGELEPVEDVEELT